MNPEHAMKLLQALLLAVFLAFPWQAFSQEMSSPDANAGDPPEAAGQLQVSSGVSEQGSLTQGITVLPVQTGLSPQARETYGYLLFIQAIFDEDEAALLEAAPLLGEAGAPPGVWLDGGVWLMSRKSPMSVPYLETALQALPEDMSLNLLYAEALGDHGMANRGINLMREYLARHPGSLDARIELALLLVKDRQFTEARKLLNAISPKQRTPLVDYYQAKALIGMDKRSEAIPFLRKAVKGMPDFVDAIAELAFLYEQENNLREARLTYDRLQKLGYSPQEVALRQVALSLKMKQPEKAAQYARQGPDTMAFRLGAANLFMEARHYLQAESILKKVAEGPDAPVEVYLLLADLVYEQTKKLPAALAWLDKMPKRGDGPQKAALLRAQLLAEAGKLKDALSAANQGCEKFPEYPELAEMRIRILAKAESPEAALTAARLAAAKWPDNPGVGFLFGSLLDETGQKAEALEIMEALLKKQPDNYQALNYVGYTLAEAGRDLTRALELLKRADSLAPNQAYIVDSLAWAMFRAGQEQEALEQIRRAASLDNVNDAAIWEHYGDIAAKAGQKEEARKAYRRAIELKSVHTDDIRKKMANQ